MGEFAGVLVDSVQKGNMLLVLVLIAVLVVLNAHKLYPLMLERKKHRLKGLEAALHSDHVQGIERECLEEQAATEHFYAATGIMLEKAPRQAFMRIYERSGGRLQFGHFKRAVSHVRYDQGEFELHLGRVERLMMWTGIFVGGTIFVLSSTGFCLTLYLLLMQGIEPVGQWLNWLVFAAIGWFTVMSSRSSYSANRIRKEMARQAAGKPLREEPAGTNP